MVTGSASCLTVPATTLGQGLWCISQVQNPPLKLAVQADRAVNLKFMKERLDEILIPYLVIKTSWHKLSTVWGHSQSCFLSPGAQNALWLTASESENIHPGRTHTDSSSKFLSAASFFGQGFSEAGSLEEALIPPQLTGKDQAKLEQVPSQIRNLNNLLY